MYRGAATLIVGKYQSARCGVYACVFNNKTPKTMPLFGGESYCDTRSENFLYALTGGGAFLNPFPQIKNLSQIV